MINPKESKPLLDYLEIVKYKYDKVKKISYEELIYLIEPITNMQKYLVEKNKQTINTIQGDPNSIVIAPVYRQNKLLEDRILERHKYFAFDLKTGMPISYGFVNNDIPYILKSEIIKKKKENNKSLVKRL